MAEGHARSAGDPVLDRARLSDLEALIAIDASGQHWTRPDFASELGNEPSTLYILRLDGATLGFVVVRVAGSDLDIVNFAIAEPHRRRGLGKRLLQLLFDHFASPAVARVFLEVREGNTIARAFYESLGFEETQRRRNFYSDPLEDAVLMSLTRSRAKG